MKFGGTRGGLPDKVELQMTPMIDIVFQLLSFFIMTFRIGAMEGDFSVKMPVAALAPGPPSEIALPPIKIRMLSDPQGRLAGVFLNDRSLGVRDPMRVLRGEIMGILGDDRGPGSIQESAEVELDCDYGLHYEHVVQAVTSVSGYVDGNGNVIKLVDKIRFSPPRQPAGE